MDEWLTNLNNEIILIYHHLDLFKKLGEIIDNNQQLKKMDNTVFVWMNRALTSDLAIGICRICDTHQKSASLVRFLMELKDKQEYLTRERFIKLYKQDDEEIEIANRDFDRFAGKDAQSIPLETIDLDIKKITLDEPFHKIFTYRDQYLAHSDKVKEEIRLTYDQLFKAFEILEKMVNKYNVIIRTASFLKLAPEMQGDWQEVFTIPWIQVTEQKEE